MVTQEQTETQTGETTEAPEASDETPEVVESATEELKRIEAAFLARKAILKGNMRTERTSGAQSELDRIAAAAVADLLDKAQSFGLKLNKFTIRYTAADVVIEMSAVDGVKAIKADKSRGINASPAIASMPAVEGVSGINTILNVVRAPKNSAVETVVEPDADAQDAVKDQSAQAAENAPEHSTSSDAATLAETVK